MRHIRFTLVLLAAAVIAVLGLGGSPAESAFPGVNGKIAFVSDRDGNFEVYAMNPDGTDQKNLTSDPARDVRPAWSPDGGKIAFVSDRDYFQGDIYVMNADGSGLTNLTNDDEIEDKPAWSPDGKKIAFRSYQPATVWPDIFVMNADGSGRTNLTNSPEKDGYPAWSPDGTKIAFRSYHDDDWEIYVMNADGSEQTNLTNNPLQHDGYPAWSPDGTRIAFSRYLNNVWDVWVMNADGTEQTNLTNSPAVVETNPAWSPDGARIAFDRYFVGDHEIYVMNPDGSGQTNLTNNPALDSEPDWQPAVGSGSVPVPAGSNVTVDLDGVTLSCANVTTGGDASLITTTGGPPSEPGWYYVSGVGGSPVFHDLSTTATCEGAWTVCVAYDPSMVVGPGQVVLKKRVDGLWQPLDNQKIIPGSPYYKVCGDVASLSLFGMMAQDLAGVGGVVDISADTRSPAEASGGSSADHALPVAAAGAAALIALAAGGWYARRRVR